MQIGVFDSGKGGHYIAERLRMFLPQFTFIEADDHTHVPYGNHTTDEIRVLTDSAVQPLLASCDMIVIACNTATVAAIDWLREKYPEKLFIGLEPMLKPASLATKSGSIILLATPATLRSDRYHALKDMYTGTLTIIEPDCEDWALKIEADQTHLIDFSIIKDKNVDVCVLACTHYLGIQDQIQHVVGKNVQLLEPSEAIARRIIALVPQQ